MFKQAVTLWRQSGRGQTKLGGDWLVLGLLAVIFLVTPVLHVQSQTSTTGDISGLVADPAGAAISNAKVILNNIDTGGSTSTTSNSEGVYRFPLVKPGNYSVSANAS